MFHALAEHIDSPLYPFSTAREYFNKKGSATVPVAMSGVSPDIISIHSIFFSSLFVFFVGKILFLSVFHP